VKTKEGLRLVNISLKNRMKHYWFRCAPLSPFMQELSWRLEANMWPVTEDTMNSPRTHEGKDGTAWAYLIALLLSYLICTLFLFSLFAMLIIYLVNLLALIMDKDTLRSPISASRKKKNKEGRDGK
jgi:hypothetical protein